MDSVLVFLNNLYKKNCTLLASEKRRAQLETLGVRKRTSGLVAGQSSRDLISCSSTVLPKGAKFMPSPPGQKPRPIPMGNYSRDNVGDMCAPTAVNDRYAYSKIL